MDVIDDELSEVDVEGLDDDDDDIDPDEIYVPPAHSTAYWVPGLQQPKFLQEEQQRQTSLLKPIGSATKKCPKINIRAGPSSSKTPKSVGATRRGRPKRTNIVFDMENGVQYTYNVRYEVVDPKLRIKKCERQAYQLWSAKMHKCLSKSDPALGSFGMSHKLHKLWYNFPKEEKNLWKQEAAEEAEKKASSVNNVQQQMRNQSEVTSFFANRQSSASQNPCDSSSETVFSKVKVFAPIGTVPIVKTNGKTFVIEPVEGTDKYSVVTTLKRIACAEPPFKTEDSTDAMEN